MEEELPIFIPTYYNPIRENVSAHEVYAAMESKRRIFWDAFPEKKDIAGNGLMFSYKEGKSLQDFLNLCKCELLNREMAEDWFAIQSSDDSDDDVIPYVPLLAR